MRLQADFENFRRRNAAEREQLSTFVTADVVGKFLKVLDNFERAEQSDKNYKRYVCYRSRHGKNQTAV